ncbi:hypothetical protein [Acinetobacter rudis]|uniref:Lipoprotein n=1 Tax=Acinetobacter rudis TaxID=632955 RepID=A0AAW8J9L2_9GAMM|nr:hypothetical protein [Acinetobacter rudis]MDQ8935849.1 hypothetical protein [Acinetobacter rudis]MDQ8954338.1 hypothetical protein [Acinetobacter rudis]MDQ9018113.1 hypothetical protein [Acinetobacter rudis]
MKQRIVILAVMLGLTACAEKKPATPEEKWKGYCTSVSNAARTIALDRQNGITKQEALDYANKLTDPTTKSFVLQQIETIYAFPAEQLRADKEKVRDQFKQQAYEICVNAPHDPNKMPDYKPF